MKSIHKMYINGLYLIINYNNDLIWVIPNSFSLFKNNSRLLGDHWD